MGKVKRKNNIIPITFIALICGISIYALYVVFTQQPIINEKLIKKEELVNSIKNQQEIQEELQEKIEGLTTEEYIEKVAREKLGLVKPGERIFVDINK